MPAWWAPDASGAVVQQTRAEHTQDHALLAGEFEAAAPLVVDGQAVVGGRVVDGDDLGEAVPGGQGDEVLADAGPDALHDALGDVVTADEAAYVRSPHVGIRFLAAALNYL